MSDIKDAINNLVRTNDEVYSIIAKVDNVDEDKRVCDVSPVNGDAKIYDVRLQALISSKDALIVIPKVGSNVIVSFLNKEEAFVAMCSEVDSIKGKIEGIEMDIDKDGIEVKSNTANYTDSFNDVVDVLGDVISILNTFKLATPSGPTITVMPEIIAKLQKQKAKLKKAQKELNTILK